jgi:hypothetical protein
MRHHVSLILVSMAALALTRPLYIIITLTPTWCPQSLCTRMDITVNVPRDTQGHTVKVRYNEV